MPSMSKTPFLSNKIIFSVKLNGDENLCFIIIPAWDESKIINFEGIFSRLKTSLKGFSLSKTFPNKKTTSKFPDFSEIFKSVSRNFSKFPLIFDKKILNFYYSLAIIIF